MLTGLVYGLMALGLSVIFGVVRVVNFAHGEFAVVAMYAAYVLFGRSGSIRCWPWRRSRLVFFGIGYLLQTTVIDRFVGRAQHEQFMLLVALAIIIVNGLLLIFGPDARAAEPILQPGELSSRPAGAGQGESHRGGRSAGGRRHAVRVLPLCDRSESRSAPVPTT